MKKTICLLILFYANYAVAQLRVEELINDSLLKVFICQQTGKQFQNVHFVTGKELKEKKQIAENSILDSIQSVRKITTDFNNDGKLDLVVSYAERILFQKYFDGFNITAIVSNPSGNYDVKYLWQRYEHFFGSVVRLLNGNNHFVLARLFQEKKKEVIRFDTLQYYQKEFVNVGSKCNKGFDSIKYYTSSNWGSSSYRYSHLILFANGVIRREDFEMGRKKIYQFQLEQRVFDSINNLICQVNLWELKDHFEMENIYDAGTSHLVINYKGAAKKIDDYGHWGNFGLGALYKVLNKLSSEAQWTLLLPSKIEYKPQKIGKLN